MCRISFFQGCTWQEEIKPIVLEPDDLDGHRGDVVSIKVRKLLQWSMNSTAEDHSIFWGLLAWLGAVIDNSMPVDEASDNPLMHKSWLDQKGDRAKSH